MHPASEAVLPTMRANLLESRRPFVVAANVRGDLDTTRCKIGPGVARTGDLALGRVTPGGKGEVVVLDQHCNAHTVRDELRVIAVVGPRDSSTHVCAFVPDDGLTVDANTVIQWVAGESGIVGCLERQPPSSSIYDAETAIDFVCDGLVLTAGGEPLNIREFAVSPGEQRLSTPVVLIGATSSESGKTVLAGELIRRLADAGVRTGAIKVTGTGGMLDSLHHRQSGAIATLDNVDAGLITTGGDEHEFRTRIPLLFREMQARDVDVIVAELGGDLVSANNPVIFEIEEIMRESRLLAVIANDAIAALGVNALNETRLAFPPENIRLFTSPFRNHAGMQRRLASLGIAECLDPRSPDDLNDTVMQIIKCLET